MLYTGCPLFSSGLAGIIFDCDGVMICSEAGNRYFYNTVLNALGLPPMTKEQEKYAFMATAKQALLAMVPVELHDRIDETCQKEINYYRDVLPRVQLMPGFRDFMERAHALGLRLAIDTNRTAEGIQRVLDFFSLPDYFNPVISISVAEPKPSPQGVEKIRATWNVTPAQILFVGDSENDMLTAKNAGVHFAAFGSQKLPGDIQAATFPDLAKIIWP